jgi:hypothetical protein
MLRGAESSDLIIRFRHAAFLYIRLRLLILTLCLLADIAVGGSYGYDQKLAALNDSAEYTCSRRYCHSGLCELVYEAVFLELVQVFTVHFH